MLIFTILSTMSVLPVKANSFSIRDRILTQEFYLKTYPLIFKNPIIKDNKIFKDTVAKLKKKDFVSVEALVQSLDNKLPPVFLKALITYKVLKPSKENLIKTLNFIFVHKLLTLRDAIDHPQTINSSALLNVLRSLTEHSKVTTENLFQTMQPLLYEKAELIADIEGTKAFIESLENTALFTFKLEDYIKGRYHGPMSYLGFIPGNKVKVISENRVDLDRINWLNERVIFRGGVLDFESPYIEMPMRPNDQGHPVFREDPIFSQIRDLIGEARESIFIDIFLFGGTLGATLSEFLVEQTLLKIAENPNFKVLILHDYATHYNMIEEMMPVFEYLKEAREKSPILKKHLYLLQANIQRHPSGIPFGLTNHVIKDDQTWEFLKNHHSYYESKIDHSKVIVIDGNTLHPKAYFGSKNWTDHSGAYYYDDVLLVEGPTASLVQHSYMRDIDAALTTDPKELKWFYFKEEGFSNEGYLKDRESILKSFAVTQERIPFVGRETVRIAEADVDGTIKNHRNILVDMIIRAKRSIHMEQLFLYDKYIVDALIKKKIENPEIEIRIMLDHNGNFGMNGLPNTIFVAEMMKYGIEVRARKTFGLTANFPDGTTQEYHQENHRKITCVDGEVILGGSSNLNPDTLQGSFREFGAQVFSPRESTDFDQRFLRDWNDTEKTVVFDIENFQAKIGGKTLSKSTSGLINDIAAQLLRSKDLIEKRY